MDGSARGCGGSYGYGNDGRVNHGGGGGTSPTTTNITAGPCGACKFLRRKCIKGCVFAAYFEADDVGTAQFAAVHRVFGASNASKLLLRLPPHRRLEAVVTLCYEALSRLRDPVYGCVAHIFALQQQVVNLQAELAYIQARLTTFQRIPSHHQFPTTIKTLNPQIDVNHDRLHNLVGDTTSFGPETQQQQMQAQHQQHYYSESPSAEMGASFTDMEDGEGGDEIQALMWELVTNYFPPSDKYRPSDD